MMDDKGFRSACRLIRSAASVARLSSSFHTCRPPLAPSFTITCTLSYRLCGPSPTRETEADEFEHWYKSELSAAALQTSTVSSRGGFPIATTGQRITTEMFDDSAFSRFGGKKFGVAPIMTRPGIHALALPSGKFDRDSVTGGLWEGDLGTLYKNNHVTQ